MDSVFFDEQWAASTVRMCFMESKKAHFIEMPVGCFGEDARPHNAAGGLNVAGFSVKSGTALFNKYHIGCRTFGGLASSPPSRLMDNSLKTLAYKSEEFFVKCQQCGQMIGAEMDALSDAIEEHSAVCLPIKCVRCGERTGADMDAIELHSSTCLAIVESCDHNRKISFPFSTSSPSMAEHYCPHMYNHSKDNVDLSLRIQGYPYCKADAVGYALVDLVNRSHYAKSMPHNDAVVPMVPLHIVEEALRSEEHFLVQLRLDVHREMEALKAQQLSMSAQRPLQIVVENCSTSSSSVQQAQPQPMAESTTNGLYDFLASPTNRIALFAVVYSSLLFSHRYANHNYRMVEMQQRIDANIFLYAQQILTSQLKHFL